MSAESEMRELLDRYFQAIRDKDAMAATSLMTEDFTHFQQPPPLAVEGQEARDPANLQQWFDTWEGPIGLEMPDWTYHASGDCGYAYGLSRMSGRKVDADEDLSLWFRRTVCARQIDGAWKIQSDHESVPYKMDGGAKALLDLEPGDTVDAAAAVGKTRP